MNTDIWRVICVYIPVGIFCLELIGFILILKYDTIKHLINNKSPIVSKAVLDIYSYESENTLVNEIQKSFAKDSSKVTAREALFDPYYRKATWVNIG